MSAAPGPWDMHVERDAERTTTLLRNGHALILSSLATSGIGFLFWILAARSYPVAVVGRDTAALSAMTFIGGVAQFNLTGALVRFIPVAGSKTRQFVLSTYAISVATAIPLALVFIALLSRLAPDLVFLKTDWLFVLWWAMSTATWALFVLEDGVLTGLRRAKWVPVENIGFSFAKIAFVVPLAALAPKSGIYLAWSLAALVTVLPTNFLVFKRAIPRALQAPAGSDFSLAQIMRYVPYDCLASLCWLAAVSLTPLLVIHLVGPTVSAVYSLDWVIANVLYLVSINMGSSMIVESALDNSILREHLWRVRLHLVKLLTPIVAIMAVGAALILRLFGGYYATEGASTLGILALSALPFALTSTAMSALRVRNRTRAVFLLNAAICILVLSLVWALVPVYGVRGAAVAWLVGQCVVAAVVLVIGDARITGSPQRSFSKRTVAFQLLAARFVVALDLTVLADLIRRRRERVEAKQRFSNKSGEVVELLTMVEDAPQILEMNAVPSASDLSVVLLRQPEERISLVLKLPCTEQARVDLVAQSAILTRLQSDERLGDWRNFLPQLRLLEHEQTIFAVENAVPGTDARLLLGAMPSQAWLVARAGIDVIAGLHGPTTLSEALTNNDLESLLEAPLRTLSLSHPSGRVPDTQRRALEIVGDKLRSATDGKIMELSWTHGDFSPGNVILNTRDYRVQAVIDWGQGRSRGIPALDVMFWLIAVKGVAERRQLGSVVCELLTHAVLAESQICSLASDAIEQANLNHHEVALWCWLSHIAGNLEKSQKYSHHPMWWAANVEPVLKAVSR